MWMILFSAAVGIFIVVMQSRKYLEVVNFVKADEEVKKEKYTVVDSGTKLYAIQIVASIVSFACVFFDLNDPTTVAIGIILGFAFIAQIFSSKLSRRLYYNSTGFIHNQKYYRYKSIKEFIGRKRSPAIIDVITFSGETLPFTRGNAAILKEQMELK